jgi:hypothetical protein
MSGEAFSAFRNPAGIVGNGSVPGIVFKLKFFGVPYMGFDAMRSVGWIYSLVVVAGTVWVVRRVRPDGREPVLWLAILVLATMRSPFMATYAFFPVMWLATLAVALRWHAGVSALVPALGWIAMAITFGSSTIPPSWNAIWTTTQTTLTFIGLAMLLRTLRTSTRSTPALAVPA